MNDGLRRHPAFERAKAASERMDELREQMAAAGAERAGAIEELIAAGASQAAIAELFGISRSAVNKLVVPTGYVDSSEAAKQLGITVREVYTLIDEGTLPAYRRGGRVVIRAEDLWAARPGSAPSTCRQAVLEACRGLSARHGRDDFSLQEIVDTVLAATDAFAESTIRTHVTSVMCVNAPPNHETRYPDLERVSRGRYRVRPN